MKKSLRTVVSIYDLLEKARDFFMLAGSSPKYTDEAPFRSELLSAYQMEHRGKAVATYHKLMDKQPADQLLKRLDNNEKVLIEVRNLLVDSAKAKTSISPAGEWLLDNFYLVEEHIVIGKKHLPKGYSQTLPVLANKYAEGLPRVYDIALEIISHSDGRADLRSLSSFVTAYQSVSPLSLGELWAIPIMLRLALIENLRRVASRVALDKIDQNIAAYWTEKMLGATEESPQTILLTLADMARTNPRLSGPFVAEYLGKLQTKGTAFTLPINWMEQQLALQGWNSEEMMRQEGQNQAVEQVSISNSINSLRFLDTTDWGEFVESMSIVEQTLREDPAAAYSKMDFATRDTYRHVVEAVAKKSKRSEAEVASIAISCARKAAEKNPEDRKAHVGYYLIDRGMTVLQKETDMRRSLWDKLKQSIQQSPLTVYLGSKFIISLFISIGACTFAAQHGLSSPSLLSLLFVLTFIASSQLAISVVDWVSTLIVPPKLLPRMDFSRQVPQLFQTLVTIPTMLTDKKGIAELLEALEVRYLANKVENIYYSLLTDFPDAPAEHLPTDSALLHQVTEGIHALNKKYPKENGTVFYLFHRSRKWNEKEKVWMGYERKRGKLSGLNRLLRGNPDSFSHTIGKTEKLRNVRYVITLDTDTNMPRETAWQMIAAMAHPLNRAVFDQRKGRVVEGYGILQPRVAVSLPGAVTTYFERMHSIDTGLDPYTHMISDVYQDLFGEGSFIGKGIYDVDIFEQALANTFPENRILSHDLLEGCYARSGLLSDVKLYERYPMAYHADVKRIHRWIRGDWQIAAWILPLIPGCRKHFHRNTLSALSRWKIFDNLRRSVVPIACVAMLIIAWTMLPRPGTFTFIILCFIFLPVVFTSFWQLCHKPDEIDFKQHLKESIAVAEENLSQLFLRIATLPYEAYYSADAIGRTLWRLIISRKHLLEWAPSGTLKAFRGLATTYLSMWIGPLLTLLLIFYLNTFSPQAIPGATAILFLWLISPVMTWWISRPVYKKPVNLSAAQKRYLHKLARRTWSFFERFITEETHWLPPDNYQEAPREALAERTSPTNIGLSLLANLAAYDFGFITRSILLERTKNTFSTLKKMERYRGHFMNWYDTRTLKPLYPRYISSVDSGNLAGHLLVLKQGLIGLKGLPVFNPKIFFGLRNTLLLLNEEDQAISKDPVFKTLLKQLNLWCEAPPEKQEEIASALRESSDKAIFLYNQLSARPKAAGWLKELIQLAGSALEEIQRTGDSGAIEQKKQLTALARDCDAFSDMDYSFLYNSSKHLLRIGYNLDEHRPDESYYDLLASEARQATYVAISQGKLPQESWFAMGRLLTRAGGDPVLLSWSGSMFEYLMPHLIMPAYSNTLLDQTAKTAVARQINFGLQKNIPWGISESGYNAFDAELNYQYRAFGMPGLGLKRGLGDDMVIAPYATLLALMFAPQEAYHNLKKMEEEGFAGDHGFYEAIDYTPSRLPREKDFALIQSYMAHHQGMGFLSLAYTLLGQPMQKRFEAEPQLQSSLLLLQERVPRPNIFYSHTSDITEHQGITPETNIRILQTPDTVIPEIQLLTNSRYHVMVSNAGGGYSRWKHYDITRWREDAIRDHHGIFCYIKDVDNDVVWSNAYQPVLRKAEYYEAVFSLGKAEFFRKDYGFTVRTEIIVSPEDDIEIRRLRISNRTQRSRTLELTSYAEVVLADHHADVAHPAFSNLFVQTEIWEEQHAILCTRRPRSENEIPPWMFHLMETHNGEVLQVSYETDRMSFLGRTNTTRLPKAVTEGGPLNGGAGSVLDPIVAIRYLITIKPNQSCSIDLVYGASDKKETCQQLVHKYRDRNLRNRAFELSWTHSQVVLRQINATEADAQLYGKLASSVIYPNPLLRTGQNIIMSNYQGQPALWKYSISGDLPIVLVRVHDAENTELVKQMIQAHTYWRRKGLAVDLVIWNEDHGSYRQLLLDRITDLITVMGGAKEGDRQGGIYVRSAEQVSNEDRILFQALARAILYDDKGSLAEQIQKKHAPRVWPPLLDIQEEQAVYKDELPFDIPADNGYGCFSEDGKEYIILTDHQTKTPAPWVNVLANPDFGSVLSESGAAYTWAVNAHAYRLSPWHNDAVSDNSGEAFYIRDEETGKYWSPAALPVISEKPYLTRHGFGYSVFFHKEQGITSEMTQFVDIKDPVKYILIKIKNESDTERNLSVTGYIEWILADIKSRSAMHIIQELHEGKAALLAYNRYNAEFDERVAFFDVNEISNYSYTTDRTEFLGRNGHLRQPAALKRIRLSGRLGAGYDPCAAIQMKFTLHATEEKEIVFRIGCGKDYAETHQLVSQQKGLAYAKAALIKVKAFWSEHLDRIQVATPDKALNVMANGWLGYQTLASRIWGRSGYYQSGGAFGFRDQLQDVLSLLYQKPEIARKQILLCASRQFKDGDVQHWWHPPSGRGVRTRCSDDYLWLPYVTVAYVNATQDRAILKEYVTYIEGRELFAGEESYYDLPTVNPRREPLYDHCVQAIRYGLKFGIHGLPLIGSGDWNDGMDRIGIEGKGESIWLGFFLYDILLKFSSIARLYGDEPFADECTQQAVVLKENLNRHGWDGSWYRRAYFDDGTPLGSRQNEECSIDSISQSWSVLSGVADEKRAISAMQAVDTHLVKRENKLIQLLHPPFDKTDLNPGYIKGYVPGVRENGGQYTHAAIWTVMAFAAMGEKEKTWELFRMINPVNHGNTKEAIASYRVEPYVAAADIYAVSPHGGRGGWTWYTGSAGWMYQLILQAILGLRIEGDKLSLNPCVPQDWEQYRLSYTYKETIYHIEVINKKAGSQAIRLDGKISGQAFITLVDDGIPHTVTIEI